MTCPTIPEKVTLIIILLTILAFVGTTCRHDEGTEMKFVSSHSEHLVWKALISPSSYMEKRKKLLEKSDSLRLGSDIVLTPNEELVNSVLMEKKRAEFSSAFSGQPFPASLHFFQAKPLIDQSPVFQILKAMPKGAALHLHDVSILSLDWLIYNVTYRSHLYMCLGNNSRVIMRFANAKPTNPACSWDFVSSFRKASGNSTAFDQLLYNNMSLIRPDPHKVYPTQKSVWVAFIETLYVVTGLIFYAPVFREYFYHSLTEFYKDNVQYIEVRCLLDTIYELNGTEHDRDYTIQAYSQVMKQFRHDFPDSSGAKVIQSASRSSPAQDMLQTVKMSMQYHAKYPDFIAGFDLVGYEDPGHTLLYYINDLLYPRSVGQELPYFFHAGETDWEGTGVDKNLIDAILLNTSRIGHGYALTKHPELLPLIKEKDIAIEINPLSNQVLGLVDDLRNHPMSALLADQYPIVISSDDPSVWGAKGLSYDFYVTFMALAGQDADLRMLKKLALNSINYSAMSSAEKTQALALWKKKWDEFIHHTIHQFV